MSNLELKAPFPYFGGKSRVASIIWDRFGNVPNYVEPFAGSMAVPLARPHEPGTETVNDADGMLVNFWRATRANPDAVWEAASRLGSELDLRAYHRETRESRSNLTRRLSEDPTAFDIHAAGVWIWGLCNTVGGDWHRLTPQRPAISTRPQGLFTRENPVENLKAIAERLARMRIMCGDWKRAVTPERLRQTPAAILLDPPYGQGNMDYAVGGNETVIALDVAEWAVGVGNDAGLRIAYCGYEGCFEFPSSWECYAWKAVGGYGNQGDGEGRENAVRERIWFSPHCIKPASLLFGGAA